MIGSKVGPPVTGPRIGWLIPYYLQLVFRELRAACVAGHTPATVAMVDRVFDDLLSPAKKAYFDYWRQRLHDELGKPDANMALTVLSAVAKDPAGASWSSLIQLLEQQIPDPQDRTERLRYLADVLESDGYLAEQERRFVFRSPLLREFWLRRVVS